MGLKLASETVVQSYRAHDGHFTAEAIHDLEALLNSWGLGDRQAMVLCSWVVADAVRYWADCQDHKPALNEAPSKRMPRADKVAPSSGETALELDTDHKFGDVRFLAHAYQGIGLRQDAARRASHCLDRCHTTEDLRQAAFGLAVAGIYAKATGTDLNQMGSAERRMFETFLLASLRLIAPVATVELAQELSEKLFPQSARRLHA